MKKDLSTETLVAYDMACYASYSHVIKFLEGAMELNEYFRFDEVCPGYGSYDIFAIANVNGIIMVEFIRNSVKLKGSDEHELGTKGLESPIALLIAMRRYKNGQGKSEIRPEFADYKPFIAI